MNTNDELKNHLYLEFKLHNTFPMLINETRGVVDGIDDVVRVFTNMVLYQIKEVFKTDKKQTILYDQNTDDWVYSDINTFFNDFTLKLTIEKGENTYNGFSATESIKQVNKTYICQPKITLNIAATDKINCIKIFEFCIGHELTHCYNLLQYAIKNKKLPNDSVMVKNKYGNINIARNSVLNNYKALGVILYNLTRIERNAYLAQLRQELLNEKDKLNDFKTTFDAIKNTKSYQKFLEIEQNINILTSGNLDNETKNELINYLNTIMETNFTTFNQLVKYFVRRWNKWKKAYLAKASKIAYDVFKDNNHWLVDSGGDDEIITINPNGD